VFEKNWVDVRLMAEIYNFDENIISNFMSITSFDNHHNKIFVLNSSNG
jgi:hypothetical protein